MEELPFSKTIPIHKGWSGDQKYCAISPDGTKYLLRITPKSKEARCAEMFRLQQQVQERLRPLGIPIPMCIPLEMSACADGIYAVQSWIDGEDAEEVIPTLPAEEQYSYGLESGRILRRIHSIPAPVDQPEWETRFNAKIDSKIKRYRECPIRFDGAESMIGYIEANRHLLADRPQCFQHGDYHIGNMMIERGRLIIIDFDRYDFGDPWEEFNRIVWCAQASPRFASGMVDGYFGGQVPIEFWKLLALYISSNTLSSVSWAISFGQQEIDTMLRQSRDILTWYDNMRNPVPSWYTPPKP